MFILTLDSLCLATTKTIPYSDDVTLEDKIKCIFEPILKPEMIESWNNNWKTFFVTENTVEDKRCPGKMKRRFDLTTISFMIQLSRI